MNNFKTIRLAYKLTPEDLSLELELKSSSTISDIEAGKISPSSEILIKYANLFGISVDWLLERTDEPYTNTSVKYSEELAYSLMKKYDIAKKFIASWPETYSNNNKRRKLYSLETRANIAYIISTSYNRIMANRDYYRSQRNIEEKSIFDTAYDYIMDRRYIKYSNGKLGHKDREAAKIFNLLVNRVQKEPFYKIKSIKVSSDNE